MSRRLGPEGQALLTIPECAALANKTTRTIKRWLAAGQLYVEYHFEPTAAGNTVRTAYIDPSTMPIDLPDWIPTSAGPDAGPVPAPDAPLPATFEAALEEISGLQEGTRAPLVVQAAKRFRVGKRTIYRRLQSQGPVEPSPRTDAGRPRIPQLARELIVRALVTNEPTTSARMIHRTVMRAAPDALRYERAGVEQVVSVRTVQRIREELLAKPDSRLLLSDTDERAEFLRVYAGGVIAEHANDLWMMDMTRCDVLVVDPVRGKIFRPRVHAIIDVYSGVILGISFSEEEDQSQTDLTLLRALLPKRGAFADRYPYFGKPRALYWDNGSTYRSAQSARVLASLGIEDIHSRPYVSHTRGDIERFFGTLHNLERALPGYVGENAANRASKEIKRLETNTRNWLKHRRDPGDGNRLLTITEYQNVVLSWLVVEYHQWEVNGLSRHEHFVSTAPAESLLELDRQELLLLLAHRVERTVDAAGRIRLDNRFWTVPDGSLAVYQGLRVLVLTDQFALEPDRRLVAWVDRRRALQVIGEAQPAPEAAASLEAGDQRRAARAAVVAEARRQREMKRELTDPNVRVSTVLLKEFAAAGGEELLPAARGQIAAVNPREEVIEFAPDDVLGQHLLSQLESHRHGPDDPIERARWLVEQQNTRGRK